MKRFSLFRFKHVSIFNAFSTILCFSLIIVLLVLTRQAKMRYDAIQKFHRLQDYAGQVNSVSQSLNALEENAQALEDDVNQLKQIAQENLDLQQVQTSSAIDCNEVIQRAQNWANRGVPYSMETTTTDPNGKRYQSDCSGYVSMAWALSTSLSTVTLPNVARKISKEELRTGDIVMKGGPGTGGANGHVVIFEKWADDQRTKYWAYEQTSPKTVHRIITYPYFGNDRAFVPYRYNDITCGGGGGPGGQCTCCKGNALGEFCGHELCGDCLKDHIYGCNKKDAAPSMHYGVCSKGCSGSDNSHAKCNK